MKLYLKRGVVVGYVLALSVTIALGVFSYLRIEQLITTSTRLSHSLRVINNAERLLVVCLDLESGQRGYVIAGSTSFLQHYDSALRAFEREIVVLKDLTVDFPEQHLRVNELEAFMREKVKRTEVIIEARKTSGFEAAQQLVATGDGKDITDMIRQRIAEIRQAENRWFNSGNFMTASNLAQFQTMFIALLIVPLLIMVVLFWSINGHLRRRQEFESTLKSASTEIGQLNNDLESFSYSVSHDLRAPLRSVNGYAEILREDYRDKLDEEGIRIINVITNNAKKMGQLIDDLLDFSRMGRKEIVKSSINTQQLVERVIDEQIEQNGKTPVEFKVQGLPSAFGDQNMIKQVWVNLISNAIKYSSKKDSPVVEIGSFSESGSLGFYVKDNGVGFNMDYVDKLFGVFQRLHNSTDFQGTGVGLALVKRIVNRHKGRVWVEAKQNEGATFFFTLPRN